MRTSRSIAVVIPVVGLAAFAGSASAAIFTFSDASLTGLGAQAQFTLNSSTSIEVRLRNTSTAVPAGFSNSDQILTGISFDLPSGVVITGGTAQIGVDSFTVNFSSGNYGSGTNIGGEWGFGNAGISGALRNAISGNQAGITAFGGPNLDGPGALSGPQGGLVADPVVVPMGGLGAISNEAVFNVSLSAAVSSLDFLAQNGVRVEFGSDAAFITTWTPEDASVPAPSGLAMLAVVTMTTLRRRRA